MHFKIKECQKQKSPDMFLHARGLKFVTRFNKVRFSYFGGGSLSGKVALCPYVAEAWAFAGLAMTLCEKVMCLGERWFFKSDFFATSMIVSNLCFGLS